MGSIVVSYEGMVRQAVMLSQGCTIVYKYAALMLRTSADQLRSWNLSPDFRFCQCCFDVSTRQRDVFPNPHLGESRFVIGDCVNNPMMFSMPLDQQFRAMGCGHLY